MLYAMYLQSQGQPIPPQLVAYLQQGEQKAPSTGDKLKAVGGNIAKSRLKKEAVNQLGQYAGPAVAALGAKGIYDASKLGDTTEGTVSGGLAGLGMGVGLNMAAPLLGLGPAGWVLAAGALAGAGIPQIVGMLDKNRSGEERKRLEKLKKSGVNIPDSLIKGAPTDGRSHADVLKLEQAKADRGEYSNVAFAKSRDEKDLKPEDIWGYSTFFETAPDWLTNYTEDQRRAIGQQMLDEGLVSEGRGQISFKDKERAKEIMLGIREGKDMRQSRSAGQMTNTAAKDLDPNNEFDAKILELVGGADMKPLQMDKQSKKMIADVAKQSPQNLKNTGGGLTHLVGGVPPGQGMNMVDTMDLDITDRVARPQQNDLMPVQMDAAPPKQLNQAQSAVQSALMNMPQVQQALAAGETKTKPNRDLILNMFGGGGRSSFGGMFR